MGRGPVHTQGVKLPEVQTCEPVRPSVQEQGALAPVVQVSAPPPPQPCQQKVRSPKATTAPRAADKVRVRMRPPIENS
jgi:hypothetical protein